MQDLAVAKEDNAPPEGWVYASFGARSLAFSIDQFLLMLIVIIFTIPFFILMGVVAMYAWPFFVIFVPTYCSVRVPAGWLYFALQESSIHQGTFGKRICGLRVTDMKGQRISFLRASMRYFMKFASAAIMLIGFLMAAFTERHQALHDLLVETLVLKKAK